MLAWSGRAQESVQPSPEVLLESGRHVASWRPDHLQDPLRGEVEWCRGRFLLTDRDPTRRWGISSVRQGMQHASLEHDVVVVDESARSLPTAHVQFREVADAKLRLR